MEYILGVIVSVLTQALKRWFGTEPFTTQVVVLVLSLVAGIAYTLLYHSPWWSSIVTVLATAGATHNFILRKFE